MHGRCVEASPELSRSSSYLEPESHRLDRVGDRSMSPWEPRTACHRCSQQVRWWLVPLHCSHRRTQRHDPWPPSATLASVSKVTALRPTHMKLDIEGFELRSLIGHGCSGQLYLFFSSSRTARLSKREGGTGKSHPNATRNGYTSFSAGDTDLTPAMMAAQGHLPHHRARRPSPPAPLGAEASKPTPPGSPVAVGGGTRKRAIATGSSTRCCKGKSRQPPLDRRLCRSSKSCHGR